MKPYRLFVWGVPLVCALVYSAAGDAESILEQLQNEVASVSARTRSAVVSVEEERTLVSFRFNGVPAQRNTGAYSGLKAMDANQTRLQNDQLDRLQRERLDLDRRILDMENRVRLKETDPTQLDEARRTRARLESEILNAQTQQNRSGGETRRWPRPGYGALPATLYDARYRAKSGTGFSIGDGYIVTTADVVEGMKSPIITSDNGTRIKARIVGINSDLNVGLLKIQAKADLPALKLGDSDSVAAGHFAVSVGNQSGQANSVALMLVGGLRSEGTYAGRRFYPGLIQIAGTVGAGASGSPLVNARGDVIGIMVAIPVLNSYRASISLSNDLAAPGVPGQGGPNTNSLENPFFFVQPQDSLPHGPTISPNPGSAQPQANTTLPNDNISVFLPPIPTFVTPAREGASPNEYWTVTEPVAASAGYAVPINEIKPVLAELRSGQPVFRGWIGIVPRDEESVSEKDGIMTIIRAVRVEGVFPESPAQRAGVQPGDILISLGGKPARRAADVRGASVRLRRGDKFPVTVRRGEAQKTFELQIEARPKDIKPPIITPGKETP